MSFPASRPRLILFAAALICLASAMPATMALADDKAPERSVSVTGNGTAKARPDTAHITTGVVSDGDTARAALDVNSKAMTTMIAAVKDLGIGAKDIQTVNFAVHPRYTRAKEGEAQKISGYRVVNTLRINVSDIDKLGQILDAVVAQGSNEIGGVAFSIAEADSLTDEARREAMDDAKRKASLLAKSAGAKLGKVMTISEDMPHPLPRQAFTRGAVAAESAPPIEAGEQSLSVRVNVTWALD